ncbi:MAG TPA: FkbM family methyltransferase [Chthoniobacteraceae bacterium]|nr:FkbM family methyltransferase [Chthoniobacteraceae bacterium]
MTANSNHSPLARVANRVYETIVPPAIRTGLHNRWFARHSARWDKVRNTPGAVVSRVAPGVRMKLYGDSLLCEMLYFGDFEPDTRAFFDAWLRPGDVFLDVGANVGLYTLTAARIVGPRGHVHAFEPCSQTFERLAENVQLNRFRNIACHRVALSHENAEAQLTLANAGFDAWNSLGKPYMGETTGCETVTTVTLDSFTSEHALSGRNCAVKIDVEGWENQVLAGAREFLEGDGAPLLCVEFTEEAAALAGSSCSGLYRTLEELGYEMFSVSADPAEIRPFPLRDSFPNVNLLAAKDLAAVRARLASLHPA